MRWTRYVPTSDVSRRPVPARLRRPPAEQMGRAGRRRSKSSAKSVRCREHGRIGLPEVRSSHQERAEDPLHHAGWGKTTARSGCVLAPSPGEAREPGTSASSSSARWAGTSSDRAASHRVARPRCGPSPGGARKRSSASETNTRGTTKRLQRRYPSFIAPSSAGARPARATALPLGEPERVRRGAPRRSHGAARAVDHDDAEGEEQAAQAASSTGSLAQHRPQLLRPLAGHARSGDGRRGPRKPPHERLELIAPILEVAETDHTRRRRGESKQPRPHTGRRLRAADAQQCEHATGLDVRPPPPIGRDGSGILAES